jgi:hypothetical protein
MPQDTRRGTGGKEVREDGVKLGLELQLQLQLGLELE